MSKCPGCGRDGLNAMYFGLPMKLCPDEQCANAWGFWSFVLQIWFNGGFIIYEINYWRMLWLWLTGAAFKEQENS